MSEAAVGLPYRAASLLKRVALLPRSVRLKKIEFCLSPSPAHPARSLFYVGEGESLDYLEGLLGPPEPGSETVPLWRLRYTLRRLLADGVPVMVELNRLLGFLLPSAWVTFPWIRQRVDMSNGCGRQRRAEADSGRAVRRFGYQARTTRDLEAVRSFYHQLYVPYISARFGSLAHLRSLSELQDAVRSGFLVQVLEGDLWVSAAACRLGRDRLTIVAFGLLPDYQERLHRGALAAAYYFVFRWAKTNGIRTVDLLRSRPHARDGAYWHKRQWGAHPEVDSWPHTHLHLFAPANSPLPAGLQQLLVLRPSNGDPHHHPKRSEGSLREGRSFAIAQDDSHAAREVRGGDGFVELETLWQ